MPHLPFKSFGQRSLFVFVFALLMHVAGTWILPLVDRDEPRFAEATREMRERGEWVVPYFNDTYRFDKPPLIYWAQRATAGVFGENLFSLRLPSALAAALTALILHRFGTRLRDERAGFLAALIFTTSLQVLVHSKLSVADMLMVAAVAAGMWTGWEWLQAVREKRPSTGWAVWFTLTLSAGFLAKGPIALLPVGMVFAGLNRARRRLEVTPRHFGVLGAMAVLSILLMGVWGVPALMKTNGEFWKVGIGKHVLARSISPMEGHGANGVVLYLALLPLYLVTVFISFFPWSLRLPSLARSWRNGHMTGAAMHYLGWGVALTFGIFSVVSTKLPHYTLPAFPALALLMGLHGVLPGFQKKAAAGMVVFNLIVSIVVFPLIRPFFPAPQLVEKSLAWLRPEMEFASVDFTEPSLVWYFRRHVHGFYKMINVADVPGFLNQKGSRFVVLPTKDVETVRAALPPALHEARQLGINVVKGRRQDLTILVKTE